MKYQVGDLVGPHGVKLLKRLYRDHNKKWVCLFECPLCHNSFEAVLGNVGNGDTRSCGCYRKECISTLGKQSAKEDYIGQIIGDLKIVERVGSNDRRYALFKCKCVECGKEYIRSSNQLAHKYSMFCCNKKVNYSKGEEKIKNILYDLDISFVEQYTDKKCISPKTKYPLRFDFYLPEYNCCIEYDGKQHYEKIEYWGGNGRFETQIYNDNIKTQFCQNNHIRLIRIPYTDYDKIDNDYILRRLLNE